MMTIEKLLLFAFIPIITGFSYAYADSMQGSGSMPMHDSTMSSNNMSSGSMMNENNMSGSMMNENNMSGSMMGSNMSGWGNSSMKGGNMMMMSSGNVDLSMASPVEGSSSAPVTIIEFGDYQCPECDAWFKNQEPAIKANYIDTNKAKLYFVDFPWAGADSIAAAEASYCAGDQGKYWQYHDYLYQNQGAIQSGWASTSNLKSYASSLGLDTNQFNSCLDSGKYSDRVAHNREVGLSKGVQGTPTFFIVGPSGTMQEITGPQPASVFSSSIDQMSTQATPEFGPAAVVVFVIAISTIVIISAKTGLRTIYRH